MFDDKSYITLFSELQVGEKKRVYKGYGIWDGPEATVVREDEDTIRVYKGYGILGEALQTAVRSGNIVKVYKGLGILGIRIKTIK